MRARRLGLIDDETASKWSRKLAEQFHALERTQARQPTPINALRKYNSAAYCRAFLRHYDNGSVDAAEVVRYLFQNRLKATSISSFRESL